MRWAWKINTTAIVEESHRLTKSNADKYRFVWHWVACIFLCGSLCRCLFLSGFRVSSEHTLVPSWFGVFFNNITVVAVAVLAFIHSVYSDLRFYVPLQEKRLKGRDTVSKSMPLPSREFCIEVLLILLICLGFVCPFGFIILAKSIFLFASIPFVREFVSVLILLVLLLRTSTLSIHMQCELNVVAVRFV